MRARDALGVQKFAGAGSASRSEIQRCLSASDHDSITTSSGRAVSRADRGALGGSRLGRPLIDTAREAVQAALGRGKGSHARQSIDLFELAHAYGIRTKLNTIVTALSWEEDMSAFVRRVQPARWKIFQVLPVGGQNDGLVE